MRMFFKKTNLVFEILLLAILPRILLIILCIHILGISFSQYTFVRDGAGYINFARAFANLNFSKLSFYDSRLFPGYPIIIGILGKFIGFGLSGVIISLIGAIASCYLYSLVFKDKTASRFFFFLPPAWLINTSLVMTEGLLLALTLGSLYLFLNGKEKTALLFVVFGMIVKPIAVFLFIIYLYILGKNKAYKNLAYGIFLFIFSICFYLSFYNLVFGDVFFNYNAYKQAWSLNTGRFFTLPYVSMFRTVFCAGDSFCQITLLKKVYIFSNFLFFIIGLFFVIRMFNARRDKLTTIALLWCISVFLFAGLLTEENGFYCYDRYILPAIPFLFYSIRELFPKNKIYLLLLFFISFLCSLRILTMELFYLYF